MEYLKMRFSISFFAALSFAAFTIPLNVGSANAASPYQCKANTKDAAIRCCEAAMKTNPRARQLLASGNSCQTMVSCGGPTRKINRCLILPPSNNLDSHDNPGQKRQISDLRLKKDITRVGTTVLGLPLYTFHYSFKPGLFEGVMAQDVLNIMPEAVSLGPDGYYRVNYEMLGIKMLRLQ
jgi:hypothetical protein